MEDTEKARQHLRDVFGKDSALFSYQESTITNILQGRSTVLVCRTGGGKSAAYFLSTKILRERAGTGPTIVVSPFLALMHDQVTAAEEFGLTARTYNSGTSSRDRKLIEKLLNRNEVDILFLSPEMLSGRNFQRQVPQFSDSFDSTGPFSWLKVGMIVIDEIHCVSEWGHCFRPAYFRGLRDMLKKPWATGVVKLGTSATVPERVMNDITRILGQDDWEEERASLQRPNLCIRIVDYMANKMDSKYGWVKTQVEKNPSHNILLFALYIKDVQAFAEQCGGTAYHSKIGGEERRDIEQRFKNGKLKFVCSTTALSMGFDKRDINTVILTYTPSTLSSFYQMIGRAGRSDCMQSTAFILPETPQFDKQLPREDAVRRILDLASESTSIRRKDLLKMIMANNLAEIVINEAIDVLLSRGCLVLDEDNDEVLRLERTRSAEEDAIAKEVIKERSEERAFMKELAKASKCVWAMTLKALGERGMAGWECRNCSVCDKAAVKDTHTPTVDVVWRFELEIPSGSGRKIPGFAFGRGDDRSPLDVDDLEDLLLKENVLAAEPYKWHVVYVPGQRGSNGKVAEEISDHLGVPFSSYLTPVYPAGEEVSMTTARNSVVRDAILAKKFPATAFDQEEIRSLVSGGKNVLIYDDAIKSGSTLCHVLTPLLEILPHSVRVAIVVGHSYYSSIEFKSIIID